MFIWTALIVLLAVAIFAPHPKKIDVEKEASRTGTPALQTVSSTASGDNPPYTIDLEYPKLTGLRDTNIQNSINAGITKDVDASVSNFKSILEPSIADLPDVKNGLTMRYKETYLSPAILSIELESSTYTIGSAHDSTFVDTLTYDMRTGKEVGLKDLFKPGSDYLAIISTYAIKDIARQLQIDPKDAEGMQEIQSGAAPVASNYKNFLIAKDGLIIVFDRYQVAPGAAGTPQVVVPYALLEKDVNPAGLLAAL